MVLQRDISVFFHMDSSDPISNVWNETRSSRSLTSWRCSGLLDFLSLAAWRAPHVLVGAVSSRRLTDDPSIWMMSGLARVVLMLVGIVA